MSKEELKELLTLAALAANMRISFSGYEDFGLFDEEREDYWNPYTDDGDAFRLGVELDLFRDSLFPSWVATEVLRGSGWVAASRHAVVCMAAERGRKKNETCCNE